jgi:hypothetical protein
MAGASGQFSVPVFAPGTRVQFQQPFPLLNSVNQALAVLVQPHHSTVCSGLQFHTAQGGTGDGHGPALPGQYFEGKKEHDEGVME